MVRGVVGGLEPSGVGWLQRVAYEVAVEGAGQAIGYYAELIANEEAGDAPDLEAIAGWRKEQLAWAVRRRGLRPEDRVEINAMYSEGEALLAEPEAGKTVSGELSEDENERIFRERIVPDELTISHDSPGGNRSPVSDELTVSQESPGASGSPVADELTASQESPGAGDSLMPDASPVPDELPVPDGVGVGGGVAVDEVSVAGGGIGAGEAAAVDAETLAQEGPVVVVVTGPPGDGKGAVGALVEEVLVGRGRRPVRVAVDLYQPHWPVLRTSLASEPAEDSYYTADGLRWTAKALAYAREHRYDVILETPLLEANDVVEFTAAGYRVEVAIVAVPEAVSRLGVLDRHLRELEVYGYGRLADPALHDAACQRVLDVAEAVDRERIVDDVAVLRPDGELLDAPTSVKATVEEERGRSWTAAESRQFLDRLAEVQRIGMSAPIEWIQREAVEGARAVRKLAAPHLHPDAVTMHIATAGVLPPDA
ncbi:zeta toxin family protein [Kribbella sp. CA-247076]|uniref:zeta toxin family protein n=1 Tax=Kribbella sp. CA-247076 TaxID=3239941 RepID=UPI003D8CEEDB